MHKYNQKENLTRHIRLYGFLHNKYNELLIADTFRLVALSLISLFIPIFLLSFGFSLPQVIALELIVLFGSLFLHYLILKIIPRWGVKRTLILSYAVSIIMYISMYLARPLVNTYGEIVFLLMIALFNILMNVLYWSAHHIYFLETTKRENEGEKLGLLKSIPSLIAIASPFIGGILIKNFGFGSVFLLSAVLMIIASSVLFFSDNIKFRTNIKIEEVFDFGRMRKNIIFFVHGLAFLATGFLWPLFLFYSGIKLVSMGLLYLFSNVAHAGVSYYGGKLTDKIESKNIAIAGAIGHGLSLIFRAISQNMYSLSVFQIMGGLFGGLLSIILDSRFFKNSHKDEANAIMNREMYMHFGRIFAVIVLIIFLNYYSIPQALSYSLLFCGFIVFSLAFVVVDAGKEYNKAFK